MSFCGVSSFDLGSVERSKLSFDEVDALKEFHEHFENGFDTIDVVFTENGEKYMREMEESDKAAEKEEDELKKELAKQRSSYLKKKIEKLKKS